MYCNKFFQFQVVVLALFLWVSNLNAALFTPTDVASLIAAINTANTNTEPDIINLGTTTNPFILTAVDNGDNGLPVILNDGVGNSITIQNGTISRDTGAPLFRLMEVAAGGELILVNMVLENGRISGEVAGVLNSGLLQVQLSTFQNNEVTSGTGGGAIFNFGLLQVEFSTFQNNLAGQNGGAINSDSSATDLTIFSSTFFANQADTGAAISNIGPASLIANSTFSGNIGTGSGAAIFNGGTITTMSNNTLTLNDSPGSGGAGGLNNFASGLIISLFSNIIAKNTSSENPDYANGGTITNASNNIIGIDVPTDPGNHTIINGVNGNQVGTVSSPIDPLLGPLADNGGPTRTHAVLPGSPAIGAGANPQSFPNDQRGPGFERTVGQTDVGAFECQTLDCVPVPPEPPVFTPTTPEEIVDAINFANTTGIPVIIELGGQTFDFAPSIELFSNKNKPECHISAVAVLPRITGRVTIRNGGLNKVALSLSKKNMSILAPTRGSLIRVGTRSFLAKQPPARKGTLKLLNVRVTNSVLRASISKHKSHKNIKLLVADPLNENGGAINNSGEVIVEESTFSDFEVFGDGGAIYSDPTATGLTIISSTFYNNRADHNGGAVSNDGPIPSIINSTFSANHAFHEGGALYNNGYILNFTNNTFYKNTASIGGGIFNNGAINDSISNIVAKNEAATDPDIANKGVISNESRNFIGGDPQLGPLAENGGPTLTHALLHDSPALNIGANPNALAFDQRGPNFSRTVDGETDAGAYECQSDCEEQKPEPKKRRRSGGGGVPNIWPWPLPPFAPIAPVVVEPVVEPAVAVVETPIDETAVVVDSNPNASSVKTEPNIDSEATTSGCSSTTGLDPFMYVITLLLALMLRFRRVRNAAE